MTIKVLLVEDSPVALTVLKRILNEPPLVEVVGTARTGIEALELIPKIKPDVICTDLHMPKMDGLELTQEVMERFPRPILVISISVQDEDRQKVFKLLQAGAVDVFPKPRSGQLEDYEQVKDQLLNKIKVLAGVKVFTKRRKPSYLSDGPNERPPRPLVATPSLPSPPASPPAATVKLVVIGASTGGPQALQEIFSHLPSNFPVPILCVQHISEGFLQGFTDWLQNNCALPIEIAKTGKIPQAGKIYLPPEKEQMEIDKQGRFYCCKAPPVDGHCPSVTVLFQSVARVYGAGVIGILLSGMGRDGAAGLLSIVQKGGFTIAQDESTCVVFGMPQEAIKLRAAHQILPVQDIAPLLVKRVQYNS
ncbi:chemotaxis-specific protein-glutamate methyltransferase CheB [Gloeothece verrucosa]|uniref:Protein-glutamate methylesterase/protein-glutamine glutaminase n=1 Tax=Gloeothece verrucosa (strain PCC 7822) TaxID=497965 RepID=E0UB21_GLOV7|nr:chemotaxis-specific protein-glutamate methyltransferase CheB [Gloeothece verrucosa]ADN16266.1 response regulator receiver modulated CheB methylesterase [Gloeothece verrucosa PCC 7822]